MKQMNTKITKGICYSLYATLVGILTIFILYHAGWIIGDDAIVVSHTGWGHFFNPADTVTPSAGRFYPFAYVIYNILPILGLTSAQAHFTLHALIFIAFCVVSFYAVLKSIDAVQLSWQNHLLVFSAAIVCIARAYNNFLDAYSTVWVDYTLVMIWVLCCYFVHQKQSIAAMIIGLLSVAYLTYCLETNFIFPLSYGIVGLIFTWKKSTRLEKIYLWSLIGVGVMFLLLYFFICFLHIENAYDGAHGQDVTLIGNAVKMFVAQKILWLVLILVCWRAYRIIAKKENFEFWDTILLTGCAYCCGCAVMKLNWVLYYSIAAVFSIPAIVHYLHRYLGSRWAWIVMLALALFTCRKLPNYIITNQKDRTSYANMMSLLENEYNAGNTLYWYAPEDDREWCWELEQRAWLYACLQTQFAWQIGDEYYQLQVLNDYEGEHGIVILPSENNLLFPNFNDSIISNGEILVNGEKGGFTIVRIQKL